MHEELKALNVFYGENLVTIQSLRDKAKALGAHKVEVSFSPDSFGAGFYKTDKNSSGDKVAGFVMSLKPGTVIEYELVMK